MHFQACPVLYSYGILHIMYTQIIIWYFTLFHIKSKVSWWQPKWHDGTWLIVHMDPFLKLGLSVEKSENVTHFPVYGKSSNFPKRWRHRPTPRPLAFDLWTPRRLITTTMADYRLCSCFLQLTRLAVECESQQQFNLIIVLVHVN